MKYVFTLTLLAFTLYTGLALGAYAAPYDYIQQSDDQQIDLKIYGEFVQQMHDLLYELPLSNTNKSEIYLRSLVIARELGICVGTYIDELVSYAAINAPHDLKKFLNVTKIPLSKELQETYCKKLTDLNDLEEEMLKSVMDNDLSAVRCYLSQGARVNGQIRYPGDFINGFTVLAEAAIVGNKNIMTLLLSQPRTDANAHNHHKTTALMLAALNNKTDAALILLGHPDSNIQAQDDQGRNALAYAQSKNRKTVEAVLIPYFLGSKTT